MNAHVIVNSRALGANQYLKPRQPAPASSNIPSNTFLLGTKAACSCYTRYSLCKLRLSVRPSPGHPVYLSHHRPLCPEQTYLNRPIDFLSKFFVLVSWKRAAACVPGRGNVARVTSKDSGVDSGTKRLLRGDQVRSSETK